MTSEFTIHGNHNYSNIILHSSNATIKDLLTNEELLANEEKKIHDLIIPMNYRGIYYDPDHWANGPDGRLIAQTTDRGHFIVKLSPTFPFAESSSGTLTKIDFDSEIKYATSYCNIDYILEWQFAGCTIPATHVPGDDDFADFVGDVIDYQGTIGNSSNALMFADSTWTRLYIGHNNWPSLQGEVMEYNNGNGGTFAGDTNTLNLYGEIVLMEIKPNPEHLSIIWYGKAPERKKEIDRDILTGKAVNPWTAHHLQKSQLYRIQNEFNDPDNVKLLKAWFCVDDLKDVTIEMMDAKGFVFTNEKCVVLYTVRARYNVTYIYDPILDPNKKWGSGIVVHN